MKEKFVSSWDQDLQEAAAAPKGNKRAFSVATTACGLSSLPLVSLSQQPRTCHHCLEAEFGFSIPFLNLALVPPVAEITRTLLAKALLLDPWDTEENTDGQIRGWIPTNTWHALFTVLWNHVDSFEMIYFLKKNKLWNHLAWCFCGKFYILDSSPWIDFFYLFSCKS